MAAQRLTMQKIKDPRREGRNHAQEESRPEEGDRIQGRREREGPSFPGSEGSRRTGDRWSDSFKP